MEMNSSQRSGFWPRGALKAYANDGRALRRPLRQHRHTASNSKRETFVESFSQIHFLHKLLGNYHFTAGMNLRNYLQYLSRVYYNVTSTKNLPLVISSNIGDHVAKVLSKPDCGVLRPVNSHRRL